jgi:hypothetical protein
MRRLLFLVGFLSLTSASGTVGQNARRVLEVPFICQAPTGDWRDPRLQEGCEETCILMAHLYLTGAALSPREAEKAIIAIADYERTSDGNFVDRSISDTALLFAAYFGHPLPVIRRTVTALDIKAEIDRGNPVILPTNGRLLANPHFTIPGPVTHMVMVIGYDDDAGVFITNDPGTRYGARFPYSYQRFMDAIYDYPTGRHAPYKKTSTVMFVVEKT